MSRPISYTSAVTLNAISFADATNIAAENTTYPWSRGYNDSAYTTNYARFQLNATSTSTDCYIYYTFDVGDIPSYATITSVVASVRVSRNNRVDTSTVQLYAGTTAKGSSVTFSSTQTTGTNVQPSNITNGGSWTRSELNNLRVRITGRRTSTSQVGYIYLFGMSVTVNYSVNGTEYSVTISNSTTGRTEPTGTTYVYQGLEQIVHIYDIADLSNVNVTDDGNDIKSSLVFTPSGTTASTLNPTNLDDYHGYQAPTNPENGYADTGSSNYAQLNIRGGGAYMVYSFTIPDIPNDAIINSITCQAKVYVNNTSTSITNKTIQLYAGTTAKGTATTISTTSGNTVTLTPGTWTAAELKNIKIRMSAEYTGTSNRYIRFYGANLNISYTIGESVYTYTISNISADHTIAISDIVKYSVSVTSNEETLGAWVVYGDTWAGYSYNIPQGENCKVYIVGLDGEDAIDAPLNVSATDNGVDITNSIIYHTADDFLGIAYYEYSINNIQTAHTINLSYSSEPIASAYTVSVSTDYNYTFCSATVRYESGGNTVVIQPTQDIPVGDNCEVRINFGSDAPQTGYTLTDNGVDVTSSLVYVPQGQYEWSRPYYTYSLSSVRTAHTLVARYTGTTYTVSATTTNENLWFIDYVLDGGDYEEVHLPEASCKVNPGGEAAFAIGGSNFNGLRVTDNGTDVTSSLVYFSAETFEDITFSDGYRYDISNIQTNHTIVVSRMPQNTLSIKTNGTWQTVTKAYKKNGNLWGEVSDLTTLFSNGKIYIKKD